MVARQPEYLRIYLDILGQYERVKHNEPLGKVLLGKRQDEQQTLDNEERSQRQRKLEFALQA